MVLITISVIMGRGNRESRHIWFFLVIWRGKPHTTTDRLTGYGAEQPQGVGRRAARVVVDHPLSSGLKRASW